MSQLYEINGTPCLDQRKTQISFFRKKGKAAENNAIMMEDGKCKEAAVVLH